MSGYKEFSEEEAKVYDREIGKLKKMVQNGKSLKEVCAEINAEDDELRQIIADDILKIAIADLHYGQGKSLEEVAEKLKTKVDRIKTAHRTMIEDVMHTVNKGSGIEDIKKEF